MVDLLLSSNNIPQPYRRVTYDDYSFDKPGASPLVVKWLLEWNPAEEPVLGLVGRPGRAKTLLSAAILNEYQQSCHANCDPQTLMVLRQQRYPVYFIQMAQWVTLQIRLIKLQEEAARGIRDPQEYLELDQLLQDFFSRVEMLVVDDVAKEHRTASRFAEDQFDLLLRTRYNNGLVTIFTSNLPVSRWSETYSDSMRNFIDRHALVISFR